MKLRRDEIATANESATTMRDALWSFILVLPETSAQEAKVLADRACAAVRDLKTIDKTLTVSIGIAAVKRGESREEWIARADRALYGAKSAGRDRAVLG